MKVMSDKDFSLSPHLVWIDEAPHRGYPFLATTKGVDIGSGIGESARFLQGAIVEFLERQHFNSNVLIEKTSSINKVQDIKLRSALKLATRQTSTQGSDSEWMSLDIDWTKCLSLIDGNPIDLPTGMISIGALSTNSERIFPYRDTSGAGAQQTAVGAFNSAVYEFAERQSLIAAWLTKKANAEIQIASSFAAELTFAPEMCRVLYEFGRIRFFDISFIPNVYVVLCLFSSNTHPTVKYSVGCAASSCPQIALKKAMLELWQSFIAMSFQVDKKKATDYDVSWDTTDRLLENFFAKNYPETANEFVEAQHVLPVEAYASGKRYSVKESLAGLKKHTELLYVYLAQSVHSFGPMYFARVVSPDFFLHMDPSVPLNIENQFFNNVWQDKDSLRIQAMPFP